MADISKIKLPDGTTYNIKDGRIPSSTSSDSGKYISVDSNGNLVITSLPVYDGTVVTEP